MKIKLSVLTAFAALFIFWSGSTVCNAQDEPIVGGYAKTNAAAKNVVAAAKFAVQKRAKTRKATITLLSIKNAEKQVVAGLNYKICMQVSVKINSKKTVKQIVQVVVYRNLKNAYSLTNWTEKDCTK